MSTVDDMPAPLFGHLTNHPFVNDRETWSDAMVCIDAHADSVRVYCFDGAMKMSVDLTLSDALRLLQHLTASIDALRTRPTQTTGTGLAACADCPHARFVHDGEGGSCTRIGCPCTLYRFPTEVARACPTGDVSPHRSDRR